MSDGTISASLSHPKISLPKGRSPGWAAFDLKQRGKQGMEPELEIDPYPRVQSAVPSLPLFEESGKRKHPLLRSFSSVVQPSIEFPVLVGNGSSCKEEIIVGDHGSKYEKKIENKNKLQVSHEKLKEVHSWADDGLVEDVLGAVNNDIDQASALLSSMVLSGTTEEAKESSCQKMTVQANEDAGSNMSELRCALDEYGLEMRGEDFAVENKLSDTSKRINLQHIIASPVEPEWEEDDIYLSQRKEAIRQIRCASQHSRASNNAYTRGDRITAQKLSQKAREEWIVAEKLNQEAAKEILKIRNSDHDIWKLDLHGLHASEAVWALQNHLWKIESQSTIPSKTKAAATGISWQRPTMLEVVTGTGNHSRGQASLPSVVRSFLIQNGYRFDEARPGVVDVRPKFRRHD